MRGTFETSIGLCIAFAASKSHHLLVDNAPPRADHPDRTGDEAHCNSSPLFYEGSFGGISITCIVVPN